MKYAYLTIPPAREPITEGVATSIAAKELTCDVARLGEALRS